MSTLLAQLDRVENAGLAHVAQARPELVYSFRHALIQEAAYQSFTRHQRLKVHALVAEAMERLYPEQLAELSGVLAHHFTAAGQTDKAVFYARQAARRAVGLHAHEEARELLAAALELFEPEEPSTEHLALVEELADVLRLMRQGRRALASYQQALTLWARLAERDPVARVRLHRKVVQTTGEIRWSITTEEYAQQAAAVEVSRLSLQVDLAQSADLAPHAETALLLAALATYAWNVQSPPDWPASLAYAQAAVQTAERLAEPAVLAAALGALAMAEFGNLRLRNYEAVALRRLALCQAETFDDPRERLDALRDAGGALMYVGQYTRALDVLRQAETLARQVHAADQQFNVLILQCQCWFRLDRWDEMLRIEAEWTDLERRFGRERLGLTCFAVALGAIARARLGQPEAARARRQVAYEQMLAFTGPEEAWFRNQHY